MEDGAITKAITHAIHNTDFTAFKELVTERNINDAWGQSSMTIFQRLLYDDVLDEWLEYAITSFGHVININTKDARGRTSLFYISSTSILQLLINAGANVRHIDNEGHSILDVIITAYGTYASDLNPSPVLLARIMLLVDNGAPLTESMICTNAHHFSIVGECALNAHKKRQKRIRQCRLAAAAVVHRSGNTCSLSMDMRRMIAKRILLTHMNSKWLQESEKKE